MELKYKTRGMGDPRGKPRVYFSCHPADFDMAFPVISEDLLRHADCAVWYDAELSVRLRERAESEGSSEERSDTPSRPFDEGKDERIRFPDHEQSPIQEPEEILREMQLVVFAVTSTFLNEANRAKDLELPLALEHHIPILPITMESGLGYRFSNTCAKIQIVQRYDSDPTSTPYDEVLETFLDSVLVGDELAQKVRDAFDAYVFLSYRKKDRRHAQRLMRLIHENKEFRDIAIWYDEFLVPGEGFNEAIKEAFEKSSLFAMAVTPHLEEKGNYVMRVEYPMARDRNSRSEDFGVVPVEMYEPKDGNEEKEWRIDPEKLKDHEEFKYREIADLKDEHRRPELDLAFIEALARIAKRENDGSARHRFFIGLAYLNGIDMEINQELALELITGAALDVEPCMDAAAKLADMYRNGEGVAADIREAIHWQRLLSSQYLHAYELNHDPDEHKGYGTAYFKALRKLSDLYREAGMPEDAVRSAQQALVFCERLDEEVGIREQERDKALILNCLGSLYRENGDYASALDCFLRSEKIYEKQAAQIGTRRVRRDLSVSQERLGDLLRSQGDLTGAESCYQKAKELREQLMEASPSASARRDLSSVLTKLGNIRKSEKRYIEAGEYYGEALEMDRVLAEERRTPQAWDDYAVSLVKSGDIHKAHGRFDEAALYYERAGAIFRKNAEKTGSHLFLDHLAGGCEKLASVKKKLGEKTAARELYRQSVTVREQLYKTAETLSNAHALAASCYNAALFLDDRELMRRAYELWLKLSIRNPQYAGYRDSALKKLTEKDT